MGNASNDSDAAAIIASVEEGAPIEQRFAHLSLTANENDGIEIPIREVSDDNGARIEVFKDALEALEDRQEAPRRRRTTHVLHELDSLIAYANRYKGDHTLAWAHNADAKVAIVFNDHPGTAKPSDAAWRDHRAIYTCPRSPEWIAWTSLDGQSMPQDKFADFIESRLEDLRAGDGLPKPLDVLTMARHLVVRSKGTFERQLNPTTGENILVNKIENEPAASTTIPRAFGLGIPVFENGTVYAVEARIRMQILEGRATFGYVLHRRKEIERDAFSDVRKAVAERTGIVVLAGAP